MSIREMEKHRGQVGVGPRWASKRRLAVECQNYTVRK